MRATSRRAHPPRRNRRRGRAVQAPHRPAHLHAHRLLRAVFRSVSRARRAPSSRDQGVVRRRRPGTPSSFSALRVTQKGQGPGVARQVRRLRGGASWGTPGCSTWAGRFGRSSAHNHAFVASTRGRGRRGTGTRRCPGVRQNPRPVHVLHVRERLRALRLGHSQHVAVLGARPPPMSRSSTAVINAGYRVSPALEHLDELFRSTRRRRRLGPSCRRRARWSTRSPSSSTRPGGPAVDERAGAGAEHQRNGAGNDSAQRALGDGELARRRRHENSGPKGNGRGLLDRAASGRGGIRRGAAGGEEAEDGAERAASANDG